MANACGYGTSEKIVLGADPGTHGGHLAPGDRFLQLRVQVTSVALHGQDVVRAAREDQGRSGVLGVHRVQGDDRANEVDERG